MDDDRDLLNFNGVCRLFPLPRLVMFPHAVLPLHIFEPRYRRMTDDALAGDGLVTMVQLRTTGGSGPTLGSPPIETVGCLGRILRHERLPDGRFNLLLLGRRRVRLRRELATPKPYRLAEAEMLDDEDEPGGDESPRAELIALFREAFERRQRLDPDMARVLESALTLGVLTDIIAHASGLSPALKQRLLAESHVLRRAALLLSALRDDLSHATGGEVRSAKFPPPFSAN